MTEETNKAKVALEYILPFLQKYHFNWCISGSLACYIYGVKRPIRSIDIDIQASKDDSDFKKFIEDITDHASRPLRLWKDKNYDNWVIDVRVNRKLLSICPTKELKMYNTDLGKYELFYPNGIIPNPVWTTFEGVQIPLAPKDSVLRMRKTLAKKTPTDKKDIREMEQIISIDKR